MRISLSFDLKNEFENFFFFSSYVKYLRAVLAVLYIIKKRIRSVCRLRRVVERDCVATGGAARHDAGGAAARHQRAHRTPHR